MYDKATEERVRRHVRSAINEIRAARNQVHGRGGTPPLVGTTETERDENLQGQEKEIRLSLIEGLNWLENIPWRFHEREE